MIWIEYIPIFTTLFSIYFFYVIFNHYQARKKQYLLWWSIGVLTFGLGTLSESINILLGWSELNTRFWYVVGALLGGYPLAQGSIYLLMKKKFADRSAIIVSTVIVVASVFVFLSPLDASVAANGKLTGKVLEWQWVRYFSPFINTYAFIFLVGGAVYSAMHYFRNKALIKFKGNIFIAIGGLLPGIGGAATRAGHVNVLFVTEFIGLVLIFIGYTIIKKDKAQNSESVS